MDGGDGYGGHFAFAGYPACEQGSVECRLRRIRVEKAGYEAREESLDEPYFLVPPEGGQLRRLGWRRDFRKIPIGHAWPPDPQLERLRAEVRAMDPVWLVLWDADADADAAGSPFNWGGQYRQGLLIINTSQPDWWIKAAIVHEYCHAHQDWVIDPVDYYTALSSHWPDTPEGKAFAAAEAADLAAGHDSVSRRHSLVERSAEVCEMFYYDHPRVIGLDHLRKNGPRQYEWADTWLSRR